MVKLIVRGKKVTFETLIVKESNCIKKKLKLRSPGYEYSPAYKNGRWDGWFRFYDKKNQFSIGFLDDVTAALDDGGFSYEIIGDDSKEYDTSWVQFGDSFLEEKRNYQRFCILEILKRKCGVIKMPTRSGKTYTIAEALRLLKFRFESKGYEFKAIFIVDTTDLFNQAIEDISIVTGIPEDEIGKIKGDTIDCKPITVAMIQTITSIFSNRKKSDERKEQAKQFTFWLKKIDFFGVDEAQEYKTSEVRRNFIKKFSRPATYTLAFSATPWDSDDPMGRAFLLDMFGRLIYEVKEKTLRTNNVLAEDKVILFWIKETEVTAANEFLIELGGTKFIQNYRRYIVFNEIRNGLLEMVVELLRELEIKTLILVSKNFHGNLLAERLGETFIYGETKPEDRQIAKAAFLEGKGKVLIASNIYKKGITLPEAEVMVNMSGDRKESLIIQRRGRVLGSTEEKQKALTIDFIDDFPNYFAGHALDRIEVYEKVMERKNIHIIDLDKDDFFQKFEKIIKKWFHVEEQENKTDY